jgi:hypothetical protein
VSPQVRRRPCRVRALRRARRYVGVREQPAGSNSGEHIDRWNRWATEERFPPNGITGFPWCAAFVCGMVREACELVVPEPRQASVGFLEAWAGRVGSLLKPGTRPRPGDLICYRFDSDDWPDHIGFLSRVFAVGWAGRYFVGRVRTIEGNTSAGDDANGGQVQVRYRDVRRVKFIRLDANKLKPAPGSGA